GWWSLAYIPMLVLSVAHQFGWRPHGLVLLVVGTIYLALFVFALIVVFTPGSAADNRFGPPSPPNSGWVIAGAIAGISIPFVGCAAAIAIPAYQAQVIRAQAAEGVQIGNNARAAILDYVNKHQTWPTDLKSAYPESANIPVGRYVGDVQLSTCSSNACAVTVTFDDGNSHRMIKARTLEIWTTDGGNIWSCGPGGDNPIDARYLPNSCHDSGAP
ncbi:MAG: pilin, partial [Gammaproteobacteria bacterium]